MSSRLLLPVVLVWIATFPCVQGQTLEHDESEHIQADTPSKAQENPPSLPQAVDRIIDRTNAFRKDKGYEPVQSDPRLTATARYFAQLMARENKYGHHADGSRPSARARKHGYEYCIIAENIAYQYSSAGFTTEELGNAFFTGWKESSPHRKNMLDPDVTETGVAIAQSKDSGYYYAVQMFGRPKSHTIQIKVANQTGEEVRYGLGDRKYSLPPRYSRTHQLCRPSSIQLLSPDGKSSEEGTPKREIKNGDRFVITRNKNKIALTRE